MSVPNYLTPKRLAEQHSNAVCIGGLRYEIFHAEDNGLEESGAIIRNGRKILIDEEKYFRWMKERSEKQNRYLTKRP